MQCTDGLGSFGTELVADSERSQQTTVELHEHHRGSGVLVGSHDRGERSGVDVAGLAQACRSSVDGAGDALASQRLGVRSGLDCRLVRRPGGQHGSGQGMLAPRFQRHRHSEDPTLVVPGQSFDGDHGRPVAGQRPGLVQRHGAHAAEGLQRCPTLDEHAGAGSRADGGDDRDRDRDRESAR